MYVASMFLVIAAGFPVSSTVIVVAGLALAVIVAVVAVFLLRSGKNKGAKATGNGASNWQPQNQPNQQAQAGWGQQGQAMGAAIQDNPWGQPQQQQQGGWGQAQPQQAQGEWGQPQAQPQQQGSWSQPQPQAQPQQAGDWGATQASWGTESAQPQAASPWGGANNAQQPAPGWNAPAANQWSAGAGAQGAPNQNQQPAWGASNPAPATSPWDNAGQAQSAPQWGQGGQGASQPAWDNAPAARQPDSWGQQAGNPWENQGGSSPSQPATGQSAPTAYGAGSGASWNNQPNVGNNGQAAADVWGAPAGNNAPPWQQPQQNSGGRPDSFNPDGDKTILRSASAPMAPQMAQGMGMLGFVRVEEGKEPGRIYDIRKDSLSIGRSRESDIFLEDLAVSRLHASILNQGNGTYVLKDEGSANGTKVNGQLVSKYQTCPLNENDKIQLGQTILVFNRR